MTIDHVKRLRYLVWITLARIPLILDTQMKDRSFFEFSGEHHASGAFYLVDLTSKNAQESLS